MTKEVNKPKDWEITEALGNLTCTSTRCEDNLHCFLRNMRKKVNRAKSYRNNTCVGCGKDVIDWNRIDMHNLEDKDYFVECLKKETWRNAVWNLEIPQYMAKASSELNIDEMRLRVFNLLSNKINKKRSEIFRDGTQTPVGLKIIFLAQHATGTCCRRCIEEWYGIDRNEIMNNEDINFLSEMILIYIKQKVSLRNQPKEQKI